jgi:PhnB protein
MAQINPYLSFDGNCREVMNFYSGCLEGELMVQTVGESPVCDQVPASMKDSVLHSSITKNGAVLVMGSDMHREKLTEGNTYTLSVNCDSEEQIRSFFDRLSAGGKIVEALNQSFWAPLSACSSINSGSNGYSTIRKTKVFDDGRGFQNKCKKANTG